MQKTVFTTHINLHSLILPAWLGGK